MFFRLRSGLAGYIGVALGFSWHGGSEPTRIDSIWRSQTSGLSVLLGLAQLAEYFLWDIGMHQDHAPRLGIGSLGWEIFVVIGLITLDGIVVHMGAKT
jgi:hypothetical protein